MGPLMPGRTLGLQSERERERESSQKASAVPFRSTCALMAGVELSEGLDVFSWLCALQLLKTKSIFRIQKARSTAFPQCEVDANVRPCENADAHANGQIYGLFACSVIYASSKTSSLVELLEVQSNVLTIVAASSP